MKMKLFTWVSGLTGWCPSRKSGATGRREVWGDGRDTEFTLGHNEFEVLVNIKLTLRTVDLVLMRQDEVKCQRDLGGP